MQCLLLSVHLVVLLAAGCLLGAGASWGTFSIQLQDSSLPLLNTAWGVISEQLATQDRARQKGRSCLPERTLSPVDGGLSFYAQERLAPAAGAFAASCKPQLQPLDLGASVDNSHATVEDTDGAERDLFVPLKSPLALPSRSRCHHATPKEEGGDPLFASGATSSSYDSPNTGSFNRGGSMNGCSVSTIPQRDRMHALGLTRSSTNHGTKPGDAKSISPRSSDGCASDVTAPVPGILGDQDERAEFQMSCSSQKSGLAEDGARQQDDQMSGEAVLAETEKEKAAEAVVKRRRRWWREQLCDEGAGMLHARRESDSADEDEDGEEARMWDFTDLETVLETAYPKLGRGQSQWQRSSPRPAAAALPRLADLGISSRSEALEIILAYFRYFGADWVQQYVSFDEAELQHGSAAAGASVCANKNNPELVSSRPFWAAEGQDCEAGALLDAAAHRLLAVRARKDEPSCSSGCESFSPESASHGTKRPAQAGVGVVGQWALSQRSGRSGRAQPPGEPHHSRADGDPTSGAKKNGKGHQELDVFNFESWKRFFMTECCTTGRRHRSESPGTSRQHLRPASSSSTTAAASPFAQTPRQGQTQLPPGRKASSSVPAWGLPPPPRESAGSPAASSGYQAQQVDSSPARLRQSAPASAANPKAKPPAGGATPRCAPAASSGAFSWFDEWMDATLAESTRFLQSAMSQMCLSRTQETHDEQNDPVVALAAELERSGTLLADPTATAPANIMLNSTTDDDNIRERLGPAVALRSATSSSHSSTIGLGSGPPRVLCTVLRPSLGFMLDVEPYVVVASSSGEEEAGGQDQTPANFRKGELFDLFDATQKEALVDRLWTVVRLEEDDQYQRPGRLVLKRRLFNHHAQIFRAVSEEGVPEQVRVTEHPCRQSSTEDTQHTRTYDVEMQTSAPEHQPGGPATPVPNQHDSMMMNAKRFTDPEAWMREQLCASWRGLASSQTLDDSATSCEVTHRSAPNSGELNGGNVVPGNPVVSPAAKAKRYQPVALPLPTGSGASGSTGSAEADETGSREWRAPVLGAKPGFEAVVEASQSDSRDEGAHRMGAGGSTTEGRRGKSKFTTSCSDDETTTTPGTCLHGGFAGLGGASPTTVGGDTAGGDGGSGSEQPVARELQQLGVAVEQQGEPGASVAIVAVSSHAQPRALAGAPQPSQGPTCSRATTGSAGSRKEKKRFGFDLRASGYHEQSGYKKDVNIAQPSGDSEYQSLRALMPRRTLQLQHLQLPKQSAEEVPPHQARRASGAVHLSPLSGPAVTPSARGSSWSKSGSARPSQPTRLLSRTSSMSSAAAAASACNEGHTSVVVCNGSADREQKPPFCPPPQVPRLELGKLREIARNSTIGSPQSEASTWSQLRSGAVNYRRWETIKRRGAPGYGGGTTDGGEDADDEFSGAKYWGEDDGASSFDEFNFGERVFGGAAGAGEIESVVGEAGLGPGGFRRAQPAWGITGRRRSSFSVKDREADAREVQPRV